MCVIALAGVLLNELSPHQRFNRRTVVSLWSSVGSVI